jgi:hypothetical protein
LKAMWEYATLPLLSQTRFAHNQAPGVGFTRKWLIRKVIPGDPDRKTGMGKQPSGHKIKRTLNLGLILQGALGG